MKRSVIGTIGSIIQEKGEIMHSYMDVLMPPAPADQDQEAYINAVLEDALKTYYKDWRWLVVTVDYHS